jgi:hypothetical protein
MDETTDLSAAITRLTQYRLKTTGDTPGAFAAQNPSKGGRSQPGNNSTSKRKRVDNPCDHQLCVSKQVHTTHTKDDCFRYHPSKNPRLQKDTPQAPPQGTTTPTTPTNKQDGTPDTPKYQS